MTRAEARALGLKLYSGGRPCHRGHESERYVVSADCKQCVYERTEKMDARAAAATKAEYQRKNKDRANKYKADWLAKNPEKRHLANVSYYQRNKAKESARTGRWAKENPGRVCASVRKRQLAKIKRTPPWANMGAISEIYEIAAKQSADTGIPHEVDHVIPLQGKTVSGLHVAENLSVVPCGINRSKRNKFVPFSVRY